MKRQLQGLESKWKELQAAVQTSEIWNEDVAPMLGRLNEVLPQGQASIAEAVAVTDTMVAGFHNLASAIDSGSMENVADAMRRMGGMRSVVEQFGNSMTKLQNGEQTMLAAIRARSASEEGDYAIKRAARNMYEPLTESESERYVAEISAKAAAGVDLVSITSDLDNQLVEAGQGRNWRSRKEDIEAVTQFSRILGESEENRLVIGVRKMLDNLQDNMNKGRYDSTDVGYAHGQLSKLRQDLEHLQRIGYLAKSYGAEAAR